MRLNIFIWMILAGCLFSCEKEKLTPSKARNPFAPDPEATDATSKLRRDFYEKTGCFLLFNDTLRHEYKGLNASGEPYYDTELLAMDWDLGAVKSGHTLRFEYLNQEQQQKAYDFLVNDLYDVIKTMPYSILVVNKMELSVEDFYTGERTWVPQTFDMNSRCLAIAIEGLFGDVEPMEFAQDLCCAIIFGSFGGSETNYWEGSEAIEFLNVNIWDYDYPKFWYGVTTLEDLYPYGFIADTNGDNLPTAVQDACAYIKAILFMTDQESREKYGMYYQVMQKYEIMKPLAEKKAEKLGIKFK